MGRRRNVRDKQPIVSHILKRSPIDLSAVLVADKRNAFIGSHNQIHTVFHRANRQGSVMKIIYTIPSP